MEIGLSGKIIGGIAEIFIVIISPPEKREESPMSHRTSINRIFGGTGLFMRMTGMVILTFLPAI